MQREKNKNSLGEETLETAVEGGGEEETYKKGHKVYMNGN